MVRIASIGTHVRPPVNLLVPLILRLLTFLVSVWMLEGSLGSDPKGTHAAVGYC